MKNFFVLFNNNKVIIKNKQKNVDLYRYDIFLMVPPNLGTHEKLENSEFTKILLLSETYRRPIRDRHAWSETHQRPQHFIRDLLETDMPHRRPTFRIRDPSKTSTCVIGDPLETDMPHRRLIGDWHSIGRRPIYMPNQRMTCLSPYIIPI